MQIIGNPVFCLNAQICLKQQREGIEHKIFVDPAFIDPFSDILSAEGRWLHFAQQIPVPAAEIESVQFFAQDSEVVVFHQAGSNLRDLIDQSGYTVDSVRRPCSHKKISGRQPARVIC